MTLVLTAGVFLHLCVVSCSPDGTLRCTLAGTWSSSLSEHYAMGHDCDPHASVVVEGTLYGGGGAGRAGEFSGGGGGRAGGESVGGLHLHSLEGLWEGSAKDVGSIPDKVQQRLLNLR